MTIQFQDISRVRITHPNKKIVLALGSFDIIHPGHIKYLEWAKQQGDILVVTLKSDEQIADHKGASRPIVSGEDRVDVVSALKPVDYALIGAPGGLHEAAVATALALDADVVVLGPDWGEKVRSSWEAEFPQKTISVAPHQSDRSTTEIIDKIKS